MHHVIFRCVCEMYSHLLFAPSSLNKSQNEVLKGALTLVGAFASTLSVISFILWRGEV